MRTSTSSSPSQRSLPGLRWRLMLWTGLAGLWWSLAFIGTHVPGHIGDSIGSFDKVEHASAFFGLAFLLCGAYGAWRPEREWGYFLVYLAVIAYGGLDEWTQSFVPYRSPDVRDWLADAGGAALGVGLMFLFAAFWRSRSASMAAAASPDVSTR